eukprot:719490-Hanusia_phi.AAC.3
MKTPRVAPRILAALLMLMTMVPECVSFMLRSSTYIRPSGRGPLVCQRARDARASLAVITMVSENRRGMLKGAISSLLAPVFGLSTSVSESMAAVPTGGSVAVVGAGGGTGKECVDALIRRGIPVRAIIRAKTNSKGKDFVLEGDSSLVSEIVGDITAPDTLRDPLKGCKALIFAASASKKGGDPQKVDYQGLLNCAQLCIDQNIERLVVVSSGAVSRPDSAVYKFLNLFGSIMYWKIQGENEMKSMYKAAKAKNPSFSGSYTIVRPGGLTEGPSLGVSSIELNQGDTKSGRIARADVAEICVESIFSKDAADTTFECYYKDTAKPLEGVGLSNLFKKKTSDTEAQSNLTGKERQGDSWPKLFSGLEKDV